MFRQLIAAGWSSADIARLGRSHALALRLFAGRHRGNGKPFICHLAGTASIAATFEMAPDAVLAALLHAAYQQGRWPRGEDRRAAVIAAAGPAVEALVDAYTRLPWPARLEEAPPVVLLLRLANELEDHLDGAMAFAQKPPVVAGSEEAKSFIAMAVALGKPALGAALETAFADMPEVPDVLRSQHDLSYDATRPAGPLARLRAAIVLSGLSRPAPR